MSKKIGDNIFIPIKNNRIEEYNLPGKLRNYAIKNDATFILRNPANKVVGYYVFKLENKTFKLVHSSFEEKYRNCIPEFEQYILKTMRIKILTRITNKAVINHYIIQARPTPIPYINLITLILAVMIICMSVTKQISICFLIGIILCYFAGIQIIEN